MTRILFLVPTPTAISPGQRFRFEHYLPYLDQADISYTIRPFWSLSAWKQLFKKGRLFGKVLAVFSGTIKRFFDLFSLGRYDYIYIYRETLPVGPPVVEWLIAKVFRKKIIYDFDDAIWIPMASEANPLAAKIKCTWKVGSICKWSYIVTTGNEFLGDYARRFARNVKVIPTVVNTETSHNTTKDHHDMPLAIGWTGTFTNFIHLPLMIPAIKKLKEKYRFDFIIIADKDPGLTDIDYIFKPWNLSTEIKDLLSMHIGLMPLIKTDVQLGKCAFKAIQYMSLGVPAVVSPVGANCEVVNNGVNGYWADTTEEWYNTLETLLTDSNKREQMGTLAQETINNKYSVKATWPLFIDLFTKPVS